MESTAYLHLRTAIQMLAQRPDPDFRNAAKEAISAVESVAKVITGNTSGGLTPALRAVADATGMHPAMREAFEKLYGYTSDEDGIRHAIIENPKTDFADAKYLIVSCSAFVNWLIVKADEAGLLKN